MEAVVAPYSADHRRQSLSVSPYNNKQMQIRSPRNRAYRSVNLAAAPWLSENSAPILNNIHGRHVSGNAQKQPPLLPLPVIYGQPDSGKPKTQRLARHHSLNHPNKPCLRRQGSAVVMNRGSGGKAAPGVLVPGPGRLGPDPNELPKYISISKVPNPSAPLALPEPAGGFSGSVFELAPPPSCLPLPKFYIRQKLGCNAEVGVNTGATDGLRRILRLP